MLQPLQIEDVSTRYPQEIAELRDFLSKTGLTLDSSGTLHNVGLGLREDRTFRRDLTSHLWVALHAAGPRVRHADLLAMLAIAAAGQQLAAEAADADAHELLRFVMQVWSSYDLSPAPYGTAPAGPPLSRPSATLVALQLPAVAPLSFTRGAPSQGEASLSFDMPQDEDRQRRITWISAAVCALAVLLVGVLLHSRTTPSPTASAPVVGSPASATAPEAMAARSQAAPQEQHVDAQRAETKSSPTRSDARFTPYSHLPESPDDLPAVASRNRAKPSPAIPMAAGRSVVASNKPPAQPYARSSRNSAAAKSNVYAGADSSYVPRVTPVDNFKTRGAPMSAVMARQATVRPTSLGIMAANVTYSPAPAYPPAASAERLQGEVKLEAEVGRDGSVESTRIISGPPLLADAAADAVQHWRYRPYLYEGRPVAMNAQIVMDFQLP